MKSEIDPKIMAAIVVVVLLVIAGVGWTMFAPKQQSKAEQDSYLASHPGAKAAKDNMAQMQANPQPPPGAGTGGRQSR